MKLYPYQEAGVRWLVDHPRAGLFDDQGLGKTIQVLHAAKQMGVERMLVVAPAVALHNWAREFARVFPGRRAQVLTTGRDVVDPRANIVVVSHGLFTAPKINEQLRGFRALVVDEAHFFRNPNALRTRKMFLGPDALVRRSGIVWALTGTPMPNDSTEVWAMLAGIAPALVRDAETGKLLSYAQWRDRFCVTVPSTYGTRLKVIGIQRAPELRSRLGVFSLRRLKVDVLPDLPPIRYSTVLLDGGSVATTELEQDAELWGLQDDPDEMLQDLQANSSFAEWRHECGLAKVDAAVTLLADELRENPTKKVVVVAHHLDVIENLCADLASFGCEVITGAVSPAARDVAVQAFQKVPAVRVILLQITAGGTAITLTAAQDVVFVEQSFVPGDNAQVADRAHRIGQRGSVHVRFLSLAGSIDEIVVEILRRKTEMIRQVIR